MINGDSFVICLKRAQQLFILVSNQRIFLWFPRDLLHGGEGWETAGVGGDEF